MTEPISARELAIKLFRKRPHWFKGPPTVSVVGDEKAMGKVVFTFPDGVATVGAYLYDKAKITQMATEAVDDFGDIINEWYRELYREG